MRNLGKWFGLVLFASSFACEKKGELVDRRDDISARSEAMATTGGALIRTPCQEGADESRVRYELSNPPVGEDCNTETQTRTCTDGVWTAWGGTFKARSCSFRASEPDPDLACDGKPNGSQETRITYEMAEVEPGQSNNSETQTRSCGGGKWTEWQGESNYQFLSYVEKTVDEIDCGDLPEGQTQSENCQKVCLGADDNTVYHMGTIETAQFFVNAIVSIAEACITYEVKRKCADSGWIPEPSDSSRSADWTESYKSCSNECINQANQSVGEGSTDTRSGFTDVLCSGNEVQLSRTCQANSTWSSSDPSWETPLYSQDQCDGLVQEIMMEIID